MSLYYDTRNIFYKTTTLSIVALLILYNSVGVAQEKNQLFAEARAAFIANKQSKLDRLTQDLRGHPLVFVVEAWRLRGLIDTAIRADRLVDKTTQNAVEAFLRQRPTFYVSERLRRTWLKYLANSGLWSAFDRHAMAPQRQTDLALDCRRIERAAQSHTALTPELIAKIRPLWQHERLSDGQCGPLFDRFIDHHRDQRAMLAQRYMVLLENRHFQAARRLATKLWPTLTDKALKRAIGQPMKVLRDTKTTLTSAADNALVATAVQKYCRGKPRQAAKWLTKNGAILLPSWRNWLWGQIGRSGARDLVDDAFSWYQMAADGFKTASGFAWWVRAALRVENYRGVVQAIDAMPPDLRAQPVWRYWLGTAYQQSEQTTKARNVWQQFTPGMSYYHSLIADQLGEKAYTPGNPPSPKAEALNPLDDNDHLQYALALNRVGLTYEASQEWNQAIWQWPESEQYIAAHYARAKNFWGRSVGGAKRLKTIKPDLDLLFPEPYIDHYRYYSETYAVSLPWILGLSRQESHFDRRARSFAGANGLMQLMPRTARWMAKRLQLPKVNPQKLADAATNIQLGTAYMAYSKDLLRDHTILATAGYNAGPGRAKKWQHRTRALKATIYIETIPFDETREYVQAVLNNAAWYDVKHTGQALNIRAWLTPIPKR